jgi:hypothetical protein
MKIGTVLLAVMLCIPTLVCAQARDPLAGAWEQISARNVTTGRSAADCSGTATHDLHRWPRAATNRAKSDVPLENRTREQLLERSNAAGQYGTYEVNGTRFTRRIVSALEPSNEGREVTAEFKIDGETLIVTGTNPQGQSTEQRFRKLR